MMKIPMPKLKFANREVDIDATPADLYLQCFGNEGYSFLYESLESHGKRGRFSFCGGRPVAIFKTDKEHTSVSMNDSVTVLSNNPVGFLKNWLKESPPCPDIVPFPGGIIGYIGYDAIRRIEEIPDENPDELGFPEMYFIIPSEIVVFDHLEGVIQAIVYDETDPDSKLEILMNRLLQYPEKSNVYNTVENESTIGSMQSNVTKEAFEQQVRTAKEYILAGDIFQVVLSQRFTFDIDADPFQVYAAMRITNPSPYMYYLNFDGLHILGSSPEILIKREGDTATTRPLAGTRPRGTTPEEDQMLEQDLLQDEKERAEHVMLVDLARNDLGRVCRAGSVKTSNLFDIEKYSRVMHIVSHVDGKLSSGQDDFDLFAATFPAGTVSGAPKIRAMEIIDELETTRRGIYAGGIGYFGFSDSMDFCIAIRTMIIQNGKAILQAGAGIVADSDPTKEYEETLNKTRALINALERVGETV